MPGQYRRWRRPQRMRAIWLYRHRHSQSARCHRPGAASFAYALRGRKFMPLEIEPITSSRQSAYPLCPVGVDGRRVLLTLERRAIGREAQIALLRRAVRPAQIRAANVLARLPPAHVAVDELVSEGRALFGEPAHPEAIRRVATDSTVLPGIAKPIPAAWPPPSCGSTAARVGMPMTRPARSTSAPPELPGLIAA